MSLKITVTRVEGPSKDCRKPIVCDSFDAANVVLRKWSETVGEDVGYDKCDFSIFDDTLDPKSPIEYNGRYDLYHWSKEFPDLKSHVLENLEFISGRAEPTKMTLEQYESCIAMYDDTKRDSAWAVHEYWSVGAKLTATVEVTDAARAHPRPRI